MIVPVGTIIRQIFLLVSTGADVTPWGDWPEAAAAAAMIAGIMYIIRISPCSTGSSDIPVPIAHRPLFRLNVISERLCA
jgi:hypothetical protein